MEKLILIKYGELTTKKSNRKVFIQLLEDNIKKISKRLDNVIASSGDFYFFNKI